MRKHFTRAIFFPLFFVGILWVVHLYKITFLQGYGSMGIYPRTQFGLMGILTSPLAHGDFQHLISNSVPLLVTLFMLFFFYRRIAVLAFILIYLFTGVSVWLFARQVFHIGASGLVYGLIAFIFWIGVFRRNIKSIILSLIIVILYSGYIMGVLPNQDGISWESHLAGGIVGIFVAYTLRLIIEKDEEQSEPSWAHDSQDDKYFLNRDAFEFTKEQRKQLESGGYYPNDSSEI